MASIEVRSSSPLSGVPDATVEDSGEMGSSEFETVSAYMSSIRVDLSKAVERTVKDADDLKKTRAAGPKEGDARAPIMVSHKTKEILVPESAFLDEHNLPMILIGKLSSELGYRVIGTKSNTRYSHKEPSKETKDFLVGLILGVDDKVNITFSKKSSNIENGRAIAAALRLRGTFRRTPHLGMGALRKLNAYFGNDQKVDPKTKVVKERTLLDYYLEGLFSEEEDVTTFKRAVVGLFEQLNMSDYVTDTQLQQKIYEDNITKMEVIMDRFRRIPKGDTRPKKRDSKKGTVGKLPEKPSASPVMQKEELKLLNDFFEPVWTNLSKIKSWSSFVLRNGFKQSEKIVESTLKLRWELVESFSAVTTARLRGLKALSGDSKLTKRRVSKDDFATWFSTRKEPNASWHLELADIIKPLTKLSQEWCKALAIPIELLEKVRGIQAESESIRFTRATARDEKPGVLPVKAGPNEDRFGAFIDAKATSFMKNLYEKTTLKDLIEVVWYDSYHNTQVKANISRKRLEFILGVIAESLPEWDRQPKWANNLTPEKIKEESRGKARGPNSLTGSVLSDAVSEHGYAATYINMNDVFPGKEGKLVHFWEEQDWQDLQDLDYPHT